MISCFYANAQEYDLSILHGRVLTKEKQNEGVLVTNATTKGAAVLSDMKGYFDIEAKEGDTLKFSSPDYIEYTYVVNEFDIKRNPVLFPLEQIYGMNRLNEIVITKLDSRSLGLTDKYTRFHTPAERQLKKATTGGGIIPVDPIVNYFTGRTSMLKKALSYEREGFKVDKFFNAISTARLEGYYKIPADYTDSFAYFAVTRKEIKDILDSTPIDMKTLESNITPLVFEFLEMIADKPN